MSPCDRPRPEWETSRPPQHRLRRVNHRRRRRKPRPPIAHRLRHGDVDQKRFSGPESSSHRHLGKRTTLLRLPGVVGSNAYKQVVVTPIASGRVTRAGRIRPKCPARSAAGGNLQPELAEVETRFVSARALDAHERELQPNGETRWDRSSGRQNWKCRMQRTRRN